MDLSPCSRADLAWKDSDSDSDDAKAKAKAKGKTKKVGCTDCGSLQPQNISGCLVSFHILRELSKKELSERLQHITAHSGQLVFTLFSRR